MAWHHTGVSIPKPRLRATKPRKGRAHHARTHHPKKIHKPKVIKLPKGPNLAGHSMHMPAHPRPAYFTVK